MASANHASSNSAQINMYLENVFSLALPGVVVYARAPYFSTEGHRRLY